MIILKEFQNIKNYMQLLIFIFNLKKERNIIEIKV